MGNRRKFHQDVLTKKIRFRQFVNHKVGVTVILQMHLPELGESRSDISL